MARAALRAVFLATLLFAHPALAEKPRREVHLAIEDCRPSALDVREAYAAAALELELADATAAEPERVELNANLACEHGVKAHLTLKTADQSASRVIALDDVRVKDRPRVLALSLAELVRSEWRWVTTGKTEETEPPLGDERRTHPDAKQPADSATAATTARPPNDAAARTDDPAANAPSQPSISPPTSLLADRSSTTARAALPERGLSLELLGHARELFEGPNLLYGVTAGARGQRFSASLEALFGGARGALGTASVGCADARLAYEILRVTQGPWLFGAEPGIAGGLTWLSGTPAGPGIDVSPTTGFYGDARLALRAEFRAGVSPVLSLEVGRALGLAAKEERRTLAVTGGWFTGAALGLVVGR